ncbi:S-adenosyl-L-methionine-dependent methyltransferase [Ephemerocybe angulata]|uniref:S-adenosyl-L-methionine-dependent methyltransferase n=1 Tax=Ephemerocybe angulata TaxID=980116 RepID=A0A8H6M4G5_9AGAR|nr:S-adenosyl-L-methionine-dependent methyltransferase [Tulosesus angulatus]
MSAPLSLILNPDVEHTFPPADDADEDCMSVGSEPMSPSSSNGHDMDTDSVRAQSPCLSLYSVTSSMQEFGRALNNHSEVYRLPADEPELNRLRKQHTILTKVTGKYSSLMAEVMLEPDFEEPGRQKKVVDLGCGSGSWSFDVARDFPDSENIAIDLVPMQIGTMPPNCTSEVDDINLGMEHYYNHFNVAHTRLVASGVADYRKLIKQMSRMVRAGGLIDVTEWDFNAYDEWFQRIEVDTKVVCAPWWPKWLAFAKESINAFGGDINAATDLYDTVVETRNFEQVSYRDSWLPSSPWKEGDAFNIGIGQGMLEDISDFMDSGRPLLLGRGYSEEVVDTLQVNALEELKANRSRTWIRLQSVDGIKRKDIPPARTFK